MFRLLICGGRAFQDWNQFLLVMIRFELKHRAPSLVIHGGAQGADTLADRWAKDRRIPVLCYAADWDSHRMMAGPIRNEHMLRHGKPDAVMAFPGGSGTGHMIRIATGAGVRVYRSQEFTTDD